MRQFSELLSQCSRYSLSVSRDGRMWRVDCHVQGTVGLRSVTLAVVREGANHCGRLLDIAVPCLSCVEDWTSIVGVSAEKDVSVGRGLAAMFVPAKPVVVQRFDVSWIVSHIRQQLVSGFSGLEPLSALEYLRFRLSAVFSDAFFDTMPMLRKVNMIM